MKLFRLTTHFLIAFMLVQVAVSCDLFKRPSTETKPQFSISVQVQDCSAVTATVSVSTSPTNSSPFLAFCVPSSSIANVVGNESDMKDSEQEWIKNKKNLSYKQLLSDFGATKDSTFLFTNLTPGTDYTALAYCIDEDKDIVSNITTATFTTAPAQYGKVGTCIWHDVFVSEYYPTLKDYNLDLPADVYMDTAKPGVYTIMSPYNYANIAEWFGVPVDDMQRRTSYWKEVEIIVDASDPHSVKMPFVDLGVCMSDIEGWISAGSEHDGLLTSSGRLVNGTITFPSGGLLKSKSLVQGISEANLDGDFRIVLNLNN